MGDEALALSSVVDNSGKESCGDNVKVPWRLSLHARQVDACGCDGAVGRGDSHDEQCRSLGRRVSSWRG